MATARRLGHEAMPTTYGIDQSQEISAFQHTVLGLVPRPFAGLLFPWSDLAPMPA